jgi:hypothetical protein
MSAIIPGPYGIPGDIKPAPSPVPSPEQEKYFSLDPLVSEHDREIVYNLPAEGKREFSENIHQYIGQLGKDYEVTVSGEIHSQDAQSTIMNLPVAFHVDVSELAEAIRKLGEIDE